MKQWVNRRAKTLKKYVREMVMRDSTREAAMAIGPIQKLKYVQNLLAGERYSDPKRLEKSGSKTYSQNDEDGIIAEIFRRIGCTSKTFVEFGVEDGLESNGLFLLLDGWSGLWIDGGTENVNSIQTRFKTQIEERRLFVEQSFITAENINSTISRHFSGEIDLLSIDIDGNDIYMIEAINSVNPRVIVVEYNGKFAPPVSVAQKYDANHIWRGTDYSGASLEALTRTAARKGYCLVGCSIVGVNAFFVRKDLVAEYFSEPFTSENHYQPARLFLSPFPTVGHPAGWGDWVQIQ